MLGEEQQYLCVFLGSPNDVELERGIAYRVFMKSKKSSEFFKDHNLGSFIVLPHVLSGKKHLPDIGLPNQLTLQKFPIEESDIFIFILGKDLGPRLRIIRTSFLFCSLTTGSAFLFQLTRPMYFLHP